jgi:hypothetical protein
MSIGFDDSESSDLTLYYCLDCDTRHKLGSDGSPFVCGIKYSSDEESIGKHDDIIPLTAARLARYQVCVIINPEMAAEVPTGEHNPHTNVERRRDGEASGSNVNNTFSISREERAVARKTMVNNTYLPDGVSAGTLNAYRTILEKNRCRIAKEQANLDRCWQAANLSSEQRRELSSLGSTSKSNQAPGRYDPCIPHLSEVDTRDITSNLSNSFMTMDSVGILRSKTVKGATAHIAAPDQQPADT